MAEQGKLAGFNKELDQEKLAELREKLRAKLEASDGDEKSTIFKSLKREPEPLSDEEKAEIAERVKAEHKAAREAQKAASETGATNE